MLVRSCSELHALTSLSQPFKFTTRFLCVVSSFETKNLDVTIMAIAFTTLFTKNGSSNIGGS